MSFCLELVVPVADWATADRLARATAGPECLGLFPGRSRHWFRAVAPSVGLDGRAADAVLDDQASWSEDTFTLSESRHSLARTLLIIGRGLPGVTWTLRCAWVGDELRAEESVDAEVLAELVRASAVQRHVRYRVAGVVAP